MEGTGRPGRGGNGSVSDELFARIAVQKELAEIGSVRECLEILRRAPPSERPPLSAVMLREGVLSRRDIELVEEAARTGAVGHRRIGRYEILAKIGEGGMGSVFGAVDVDSLELCALKVLPKDLAGDEDIVKRFLLEAEIACNLRHTNIVGGRSTGRDQGLHFFAMEFVDGETVYDRLEAEGVLPEGESLRITRGIALGLQHAAERELVHRDIKPENIMIDRDGTPKLLDLGLVKRTEAGRAKRLTQSGMAIGTPHYISPEQARGEKMVDARSDIYALGATLYHMVTGQVPFEGSTAAVIMTKHLTEELDWPSDVNPRVSEHTSRLISRMMTKERHDRYARGKDVVADIDLILTGRAPSGDMLPPGASSIRGAVKIARARDKAAARAKEISLYDRIGRRSRSKLPRLIKERRRTLVYVAAVLAALVLVALVIGLVAGLRPGPGRPDDGPSSPGTGAATTRIEKIIAALRSAEVERLAALLDEAPDPGALGPLDARRLTEAVREATARLGAEVGRRVREILARVEADRDSRPSALDDLRRLRATFAHGSVRPLIDEAIERLSSEKPTSPEVQVTPVPAGPVPPKVERVPLVEKDSLRGWRAYGDWRAEDRSLVFRYDPARKYSRAVESHLGFGECVLTAEISTDGGERAEIAVWEQSTEDRRRGAGASSAVAVAAGEKLGPARGRWARLDVRSGPDGVRATLGGAELPVRRKGALKSGRIRFSLTGGTWTIRDLAVLPVLAGGPTAYEADFRGAESHGWEGRISQMGLVAARRRGGGPSWCGIKTVVKDDAETKRPLFTVADGMRLALAFRADGVRELLARIETAGGGEFAFRLSGRPPARRPTALTVPLADFRLSAVPGAARAGGEGGKALPAGSAVTGLAVGADGADPELVLSLVRVIK